MQRKELASFLRARREASDPIALGLDPGTRRRTPGLRREEVSQLSGVSVTWYTWLEQGRDITVSRQVVESLARALRMPAAEREHLFTLAGHVLPPEADSAQPVDDTLRRLVDELAPNPACVVGRWWDVLAANDAYVAISGLDLDGPPAERNLVWRTFTHRRPTDLYVDWEDEARQLVGQLRVQLARHPDDARGPALVDAISRADPRFVRLWDEQTVRRPHSARKRFQHSRLGRLHLDYVKLAADGDNSLLAFLPGDEPTAASLRRLRRTA
ncbi:helix-turn-helix transcriptional regulator [Conexibacter stalactiti]|uniref:Helix-turn-helix transcriptional regulator n=1 Tax=Conexibacter stalactiti TaxID=1940611 RepID=A0ABU4HIB7_9ACTN|nr:helix-turn-helix transcriptional regulator [Conexibacter stalactiti]MDW5593057.1 helix-turn-helix transcriptional regulator [Conexibacter stalactiti]MEC5033698.1 helix-turn-helix transcriptional regulator [Conexibacter stalactiti]